MIVKEEEDNNGGAGSIKWSQSLRQRLKWILRSRSLQSYQTHVALSSFCATVISRGGFSCVPAGVWDFLGWSTVRWPFNSHIFQLPILILCLPNVFWPEKVWWNTGGLLSKVASLPNKLQSPSPNHTQTCAHTHTQDTCKTTTHPQKEILVEVSSCLNGKYFMAHFTEYLNNRNKNREIKTNDGDQEEHGYPEKKTGGWTNYKRRKISL